MGLLSTVLGFSAWGLASRFGQLGIQRRPLLDKPLGHAIAAGAFGFVGYWAYQWDVKSGEMLQGMRAEIKERRQKQISAAEEAGNAELAQWLKDRV
ncbi:unnamed protein product [Peniophora sp. CBMAI 1063]|nr:unnamed protein product [Peniophora sp. CBMAI 1063]